MAKLVKRKQIDLKITEAPDGSYGFISSGTSGLNIPNVHKGDDLELALDKIVTMLDKLAPSQPPFLNQLSLTSPVLSGTMVNSNVTYTLNGVLVILPVYKMNNAATLRWITSGIFNSVSTRDGHFRDGDSASAKLRVRHSYNSIIKTATISNLNTIVVNGTSSAIDSSSFNIQVDIIEKKDYYSNDVQAATKSNFYHSIKADMEAELVTTNNDADTLTRTIYLEYSEKGDFTDTIGLSIQYLVESSLVPSSTTPIFSFPSMGGFVSGIPTFIVSDVFNISSTITNSIKYYYPSIAGNSTIIGTNNQSNSISGTHSSLSTYSYSANHSVLNNIYTEFISGYVIPNDIFGSGSTASAVISTIRRIDTVSLGKDYTTRLLSPTTDNEFGSVSGSFYNAAAHQNSINAGTNSIYGNALQLLDGRYQYPANIDYTLYGGYNYLNSGINFPNGQYRYVDFSLNTVTNVSSVILTIVGSTNITAFSLAGLKLYLRVDGSSPTGGDGFLDCSGAYSGVGVPTGVNGSRNALDIASSTFTSRRITFGTSTKTGIVKVRIGILKGSGITFTGITIT